MASFILPLLTSQRGDSGR
uniref:Uncharacterized protein n=1 Tax=Arundo donax TaxID=35708 RepID=A0A0A8XXC3_ARUDO